MLNTTAVPLPTALAADGARTARYHPRLVSRTVSTLGSMLLANSVLPVYPQSSDARQQCNYTLANGCLHVYSHASEGSVRIAFSHDRETTHSPFLRDSARIVQSRIENSTVGFSSPRPSPETHQRVTCCTCVCFPHRNPRVTE